METIKVRCTRCGNQWTDHLDFLPIGTLLPPLEEGEAYCTCADSDRWEVQQQDGSFL